MQTEVQAAAERLPEPTIADLAMLVARLIRQVRNHMPRNPVAMKAMDYLRRHDLYGSVLRETMGKLNMPSDETLTADGSRVVVGREDDAEPITEGWLRSVALPAEGEWMAVIWRDGMIQVRIGIGSAHAAYLPHVKTRGQLRLLLRALGIDAKGGGDAGSKTPE